MNCTPLRMIQAPHLILCCGYVTFAFRSVASLWTTIARNYFANKNVFKAATENDYRVGTEGMSAGMQAVPDGCTNEWQRAWLDC